MRKRAVLKRQRINTALKSIFHYPLTVIEAPIGYGKTTAVREFLAAKQAAALWLSFLSSDTDALFWDRLAEGIAKYDWSVGSRLKNLGYPADAPQVAVVLAILRELDYADNKVIVLDDYHLMHNGNMGELLRLAAMEEFQYLHMVVITRDTSNLDLAELTAKGLCMILPQQILRFTTQEIISYCSFMGFAITEEECASIEEYTGGWISLIYLILLGIKQGISIGRNSAIDDLVEQVLYNAYEPDIQQFLLQLSILDSFTLESALFVTQNSRTEEIIRRLRKENAFVTYDEIRKVYMIHHVLLDFLRTKQVLCNDSAVLYQRLGEWHLAHKDYLGAYTNLYRANKVEAILTSLDEKHPTMTYVPAFEGVFELFANLSQKQLLKHPIASLRYIYLLFVSDKKELAAMGFQRLNALQEYYEQNQDLQPSYRNYILGEIYLTRVFAVFNDIEKMMECIKRSCELLQDKQSCIVHRQGHFTLGVPHLLYTVYTTPGRLQSMVTQIAANFPGYTITTSGSGAGCEYVALAEYALETGDFQNAEINAFKGFYKAKLAEQAGLVICANLVLIRLYLWKGKSEESFALLQQLRSYVTEKNSTLYNTTMDVLEGYVYGLLGRYNDIPQWLQNGNMDAGVFMCQGTAFQYIVYGKAILLTQNYIQLEVLTELFKQHFALYNNHLGLLHNTIFEAAAKYRLYGSEAGCAALKKALEMARPDHLILPFAEYAVYIFDLLQMIVRSDSRDVYLKEVLAFCQEYRASMKPLGKQAITLSEREIQILSLAAEGYKREEIAAKLFVSPGTVQVHLHNIYTKLAVNGKAAAVKKAQKQKLIS